MAHNFVERVTDLAIGSAATVSSSFQIQKWAVFIGLWLPAMDDGAIGVQICDTTDGTFIPILDPADGADLVICASGSDPGFIDISDFLRCVPSTYFLQLTCAAQASGAVTARIFERG
jgi:hypothetical protein